MDRRGIRAVSICASLLVIVSAGRGLAAPPELGWVLAPGSAPDGSADTQTASSGPISGSATNGTAEFTTSLSATVDYGTLQGQTMIEVDASQSGPVFCFPPHCTFVHAYWDDTLTLTAQGVPNGTVGSLTARITTSGQLAAALFPVFSLTSSSYRVNVFVNDVFREQVSVTCFPDPGAGTCNFSLSQRYVPESGPDVFKPTGAPFGTFDLGPYDFTYGEPFDLRVFAEIKANVDPTGNTTGTASASADLGSGGNGIYWTGVLALFDGPEGTGSEVTLEDASATTASGVNWLVTVPEPAGILQGLASLLAALALSGVRARSRGARRCTAQPRRSSA